MVLLRQGLLPPTEIQTDKREGDIADVPRNITQATTRRFNHILSKGKDCVLPAIIISIATSDISIKMERKWDDLYFYKSQLKLHSVSLNTPYTEFKCVNDLIERETSFTIKGNYKKTKQR